MTFVGFNAIITCLDQPKEGLEIASTLTKVVVEIVCRCILTQCNGPKYRVRSAQT